MSGQWPDKKPHNCQEPVISRGFDSRLPLLVSDFYDQLGVVVGVVVVNQRGDGDPWLSL